MDETFAANNVHRMASEWVTPDFAIGQTCFHIEKLKALDGFEMLESLRAELAKLASETDTASGVDAILKILLRLPAPFMRGLRQSLFKKVTFTNDNAVTPQVVASAEDMAFNNLEPVAIYEVLLRCLAVNFTPSFRALVSTIEGGQDSASR